MEVLLTLALLVLATAIVGGGIKLLRLWLHGRDKSKSRRAYLRYTAEDKRDHWGRRL